jgi:hypothetical protein
MHSLASILDKPVYIGFWEAKVKKLEARAIAPYVVKGKVYYLCDSCNCSKIVSILQQ